MAMITVIVMHVLINQDGSQGCQEDFWNPGQVFEMRPLRSRYIAFVPTSFCYSDISSYLFWGWDVIEVGPIVNL